MTAPDKNYISIADVTGKTIKNGVISPASEGIDPATIDDVLKFSHAIDCGVEGCAITGDGVNRENIIDMNRLCENIFVKNCTLYSGKQNAITIKGGCYNIQITDVRIVPGGGNCDIDLGNYSDQCQCPVTEVTLTNVTRTDGKPVRVRVINADKPVVIGGNVKVYRPIWGRWPIWNIYCWLRKKGIL